MLHGLIVHWLPPKSVKSSNLPASSPIWIAVTQTFESPKHVRISILRRAHSCHPSSPGSCKASCNSSGMHMMCPHVPSALCSLWGSTTSEKQWKFTSTMTCSLLQMRSPNSEISDFPNLPCIEAPQYPRHSWMPVRRCHPPHVLHRSCHGLRPASHMESRPLTKLITGVTRMGIGSIEGSIIERVGIPFCAWMFRCELGQAWEDWVLWGPCCVFQRINVLGVAPALMNWCWFVASMSATLKHFNLFRTDKEHWGTFKIWAEEFLQTSAFTCRFWSLLLSTHKEMCAYCVQSWKSTSHFNIYCTVYAHTQLFR